MSNIMHGQ